MVKKKQTKTNHSQQDNLRNCTLPKEDEGLRRPADIHNREQEFDLIEKALMFKPILNPNQMAIFHRYIKQAELKGIKEERERIMKIIDEHFIEARRKGKGLGNVWEELKAKLQEIRNG